MKRLKAQRGFTLMELMVVIVIVAILAAVAVPLYLNYVNDARRTEARGAIGAIIMSVAGGIISALGGTDMQSAIDQMLSGGDLPPQFADALERARGIPAAVWFFITLLIALVVYPIFAMLGALLGVAIFKKRLPPAPPAAPPPPGTIEVLPPE